MKRQFAVSVTMENFQFWVADRATGQTDMSVYATRREAERIAAKWMAKPGVITATVWEV